MLVAECTLMTMGLRLVSCSSDIRGPLRDTVMKMSSMPAIGLDSLSVTVCRPSGGTLHNMQLLDAPFVLRRVQDLHDKPSSLL